MWLLLLPVRWVLAWKIWVFWAVEFFRAWVFSKMLKKAWSKHLSRLKGFVHMAWKKPEHLMRLLPWVVYSLMRFSGHVDQSKFRTSIRLQSLDVNISNRLPGNCAQIITWCFATPIHGLNWIGYYYPGTHDTLISWGYIKLGCNLANTMHLMSHFRRSTLARWRSSRGPSWTGPGWWRLTKSPEARWPTPRPERPSPSPSTSPRSRSLSKSNGWTLFLLLIQTYTCCVSILH